MVSVMLNVILIVTFFTLHSFLFTPNTLKGLSNQAGCRKHCVVKMAIFKSCLQDEGMWDLAQVAAGALERLKGLQAPPE